MPKKRIPQLPETVRVAQAGDKLMMWDSVAMKTVQVDVTNLPFTNDPIDVDITLLGSPFPVRNGYASLVYDIPTGNSIITDLRLKGKQDYAVSTTQFGGGEFRDDMLEYDSDAGSVTIKGFQLADGEKIRIYADGVQVPSTAQTYKAINDRLNLLEAIAAPFMLTALGPNGGIAIWDRPANEIPLGWEPYEPMAGRLPLGRLSGDVDFGTVGLTGGSKLKTLTVEQLPEHIHGMGKETVQGGGTALVGDAHGAGSGGDYPEGEGTAPSGGGEAFNAMNPYRIVEFIKFTGAGII